MEKDLIQKWEANKKVLKNYFATFPMSEYDSYIKIVRAICRLIFGWTPIPEEKWSTHPEPNDCFVTEIQYSPYQGDSIFVIYKRQSWDDLSNYIITHNEYGSCSGCDTLLKIIGYHLDKRPNEEQLQELMTLALNLVQRMFRINYDFDNDTEYED